MDKKHTMNYKDVKLLIDSYPGAMALTDLKGNILAINENLAEVFQTPREDLIGKSGFPHIETNVLRTRRRVIEEVVQTKKPQTLIDQDKGRWWKTIFVPIFNDDHEVVKLSYYIEDISRQKQNEMNNLANKEEYYKSLIENSLDLITIVDKTGKMLYISPALKPILGYNPSERVNKNVFEHIHPEDKVHLRQYFKDIMMQRGLTEKIIFRIEDSNGIYHHFESIGNNQLHNPLIEGLIINSRDVTEREEQRIQLAQQKQYLDKLVNSTSEIIFTINRDQRISVWNSTAERTTGFSKTKIIGKSLRKLNLFENASELYEYLDRVFAGNDSFLHELVVTSTVGGKHLWSASPSLVKAGDEVSDIVFICQDITQKDAIHGKLIPGRSYLISGGSNDALIDMFIALLHTGWNGLYITRNIDDVHPDSFKGKTPTIQTFSSCGSAENQRIHLDGVYDVIDRFVKETVNSFVCIDRVDYLITRYHFEHVLEWFYRVNDVIRMHQGLGLVRINKTLFTSEQLGFLQEEFSVLPSQQVQNVFLEDTLYSLLGFLEAQNGMNNLVSHKHLCKHFHISKVTAQKRIEELLKNDLIVSKKHGRSKFLHVTEKGKALLRQRKTI